MIRTILPEVSQLVWPFPILIAAGIVLAICGLLIRRRGARLFWCFLMLAAGAVCFLLAARLRMRNDTENENAGTGAAVILESTKTQTAYGMEGFSFGDNIMPVVDVYRTDAIGILHIPALEREVPVMGRWDDEWAKSAPCRYFGSAYDDSMVIGGYNYPVFFADLSDLEAGSEISFTDVNGNRFRYTLLDFESIPRDDPAAMITGRWDLTLFTGGYTGNELLAARFARVKQEEASDAVIVAEPSDEEKLAVLQEYPE